MKLPKRDFFTTFHTNKKFLLSLNSKEYFILQEVCDEFSIEYSTFYKLIRAWERQGFIGKILIATLGGPKYKYFFTKKAKAILYELRS